MYGLLQAFTDYHSHYYNIDGLVQGCSKFIADALLDRAVTRE